MPRCPLLLVRISYKCIVYFVGIREGGMTTWDRSGLKIVLGNSTGTKCYKFEWSSFTSVTHLDINVPRYCQKPCRPQRIKGSDLHIYMLSLLCFNTFGCPLNEDVNNRADLSSIMIDVIRIHQSTIGLPQCFLLWKLFYNTWIFFLFYDLQWLTSRKRCG